MTDTVNIGKQHADLYKSVLGVSKQADDALVAAGLEPLLGEIVKVRISQLNGCAFCMRLHSRDAVKKGETADRLSVLAGWWETQYFSDVERAALALAEEVTELPVPEPREWDTGVLTDEQISAITWVAIMTNMWNRIAVRSHYPVG